jgi:hypothetical protein
MWFGDQKLGDRDTSGPIISILGRREEQNAVHKGYSSKSPVHLPGYISASSTFLFAVIIIPSATFRNGVFDTRTVGYCC